MVTRRQMIAIGIGAAAAVGGVGVNLTYHRDMRQIRTAIAEQPTKTIQTRHGGMEYAETGTGPPFLIIHGTGGGFDQGLLFAGGLAGAGMRVIAPSRFGYLGSDMPDDPSSQNQADALVDLLDALQIEQIAICGGSAGALSALQFAIRHPNRCAALFPLVPATYAPDRPPARPWSPAQTRIAQAVLGSDFLFWSAIKAMPDTLMRTLLATDPALVAAASAPEQARAKAIMQDILPVSAKSRGLLNDARLAGNPAQMALHQITAPTLAISAEDDLFLTADAARHIADQVPLARLKIYSEGGHIYIGHGDDMLAEIVRFLNDIEYL